MPDPVYTLGIVILIGFLCWLALTYIPMSDPFPRLVIGLAVILTVLWLLHSFGIYQLR